MAQRGRLEEKAGRARWFYKHFHHARRPRRHLNQKLKYLWQAFPAGSSPLVLAEICDGLCFGSAPDIVDTLFTGGGAEAPLIMNGGVSLNRTVVRHLSNLSVTPILVDAYSPLNGRSAPPPAC
jgi:hypothetical protein